MPDQLEYTRSHEWIRQEGNIATIGITDYAQHMLGEIVSVDLPENGDTLYEGELLVRLSLSSSSLFSAPRSAVRWSRSTKLSSTPPGS